VDNSGLKPPNSQQTAEPVYESRLPGSLARLKRWLIAHHMTLMAIADTPHSIALGSAIGIFFGFTPLYPLKTLLSIAVAWIFRCNKIAAAIAVTLHDVMIWAMPALYVAEYQFGCWILNRPAAQRVHLRQFRLHDYVHWHVFFSSGMADVLASVRRFAVRCDPFSNSYLLRYALADQSRPSSAEKRLSRWNALFLPVSAEGAMSALAWGSAPGLNHPYDTALKARFRVSTSRAYRSSKSMPCLRSKSRYSS